MEEWDQATGEIIYRCYHCLKTEKEVKIIKTSRLKYLCEDCLMNFELCQG